MTRRLFLQTLAATPVSYDVIEVASRHQATANYLRLANRGQKRTLLILPVVPNISAEWGDGFYEALRLNIGHRFGLTLAAPSFSALPWYADHPSDPKLAQESYLLEDILPRLEGEILLLGFSKSGNGALTLLLRHPDRFRAAAVWDAPLELDGPGKYGSGPIYGTPANFAAYYIPALLEQREALLRGGSERIALCGHGNFGVEMEMAHRRMQSLAIPHRYRSGPKLRHHWSTGWMEPAVEDLAAMSRPAGAAR